MILKKFKGKLWLITNLSKINLSVSVMTLIGLIIALSLVSGSLIYIDSTKVDKYMELFDDDSSSDFDLELYIWEEDIPITQIEINNIRSEMDTIFDKYNVSDLYSERAFSPFKSIGGNFSYLGLRDDSNIIGISNLEDYFTQCVNGSTLPETTHEIMLYSLNNQSSLSVGSTFNLSLIYFVDGPEPNERTVNISLTASAIITPSSITDPSLIKDLSESNYYFRTNNYSILTTFENSCLLQSEMENELRLVGYEHFKYSTYAETSFLYDFDHSLINKENVIEKVNLLNKFLKTNQDIIVNNHYIYFSSNGNYKLRSVIESSNIMFIMFMTLSVPSIILSLILVRFSLSFINERRQKALSLLKMRGLSNRFLFLTLFFETVIIGILATITGILVGIPLALLMDQATGFMQFSNNYDFDKLVLSIETLKNVFILSIIFTFITQLGSIIGLSRSKITVFTEGEDVIRNQKKKRRIFRGNLDIVLLIFGISGLILFNVLLEALESLDWEIYNQIMDLLFPLMIVLFFLSPICILIGLVLSINRIIPIIIQRSSKYFWRRDFKTLAYASRNLVINKKITGRTTLLIALAISFLMLLSSLPLSAYQYNINNTYYNIGSDIVFYNIQNLDVETYNNLTADLGEIEELKQTKVTRLEGYDWRYDYRHNFLGIEENYADAIYWKDFYDDSSFKILNSSLFKNVDESGFPVIIDKSSAKYYEIDKNDTISLSINTSSYFNLRVLDVCNYWPNYFTDYNNNGEYYFITRDSLITNISRNFENTVIQTSIMCKITVNSDIERLEVINQTLNIYNKYFLNGYYELIDDHLPDPDDPNDIFLWVYSNLNFIAALVVIISCIFIFTFSRRVKYITELGLARALGMNFNQIFKLMFTEPLLLFVYSGIPGAFTGALFLISFLTFFNPIPSTSIPFFLNWNIPTLLFVFGVLLAITIIAGLMNSTLAMRANISKILKVE